MAAKISAFYNRRGYFVAQAYVPAQGVEDGSVTIVVIEGRYGKVGLDNHTNLSNRLAHSILRGLDSGDDVAAVQAAQDAVGQSIGEVGVVVEADLAVAAFDDHDGHRPVLDALGGHIGLGDEVAAPVIEGRDPGGHDPQVAQVQLRARLEAGDGQQLGLGEQGLAGHVQRADHDLGSWRPGVAGLGALVDADVRNRAFRLGRPRDLLDLPAGADERRCCGDLAGRQRADDGQGRRVEGRLSHSHLGRQPQTGFPVNNLSNGDRQALERAADVLDPKSAP